MNNLDDYRGRLLARAFHDELEKLSGAQAPGTTNVTSSGTPATTAKPLASTPILGQSGNTSRGKGGIGVPSAGKPGAPLTATGPLSPKPIKIP
jgi:hypothetical protein